MNTFGLDKNHSQLNFEKISVDDLVVVSGGSGGSSSIPWGMGPYGSIGSNTGCMIDLNINGPIGSVGYFG